MRLAILPLLAALALPAAAAYAQTGPDACAQLRQTILNLAPATTLNLPYAALDCAAISEIHLLLVSNNQQTQNRLDSRIEAIFRREGLIR